MTIDFRTLSKSKVWLFKLFSNGLFSGYYRRFVQGLNLQGRECVLEFGSGTGAASQYLAPALKQGGSLICVDISLPLQTEAKRVLRSYRNVIFKLGDASALGLPNQSVDLIVIHYVLHDVEAGDREMILRNLRKLLKPGGRLVVREPIGTGHGMPVEEIERLFRDTAFNLQTRHVGKVSFWRPPVYTGTFS